jgi:hypothetical protein
VADEMEGYSLADLAGIDVSGIEEVRFSSLPAGVFGFEVVESDLGEDEKDGERRFYAKVDMRVVEVKAVVDPSVTDKDSLLGKTHSERFFIKPADPQDKVAEQIGRIRAFITDIGLNSAGPLGDIVRNCKGHIFTGKIIKQKDKDDKSIEYARLKLDAKKPGAPQQQAA